MSSLLLRLLRLVSAFVALLSLGLSVAVAASLDPVERHDFLNSFQDPP